MVARRRADPVVDRANAQLLATQWRSVHGFSEEAGIESNPLAGVGHRWWGPPERPAVELWKLDHVGHAYPLREIGRASEWVAEAAISATEHMARVWRLC
jgi:poly(3-hydroxybutyrate) depolymerase